jgi:hypothetical protein
MAATTTPLIRVAGPPRERGEAYGEEARDLVREAAARLAEVASELAVSYEDYLAALVEGTGFVATVRRLAPALAEELEGIAGGSGLDRRAIWALNLMDEEWWFRGRFARPAGEEHCTSFGVAPSPGQPAILGQNMDLRGVDGLQVLLDVEPDDGPRVLAPTVAGMVGTNAFSEHGIGVCVNTLGQLATSTDGLPVAFVLRYVAAADDFDAALGRLTGVPHASGQNYIVGSETDVRCFECSAAGAVEYAPGRRIAHANHALVAETDAEAHPYSVVRQEHVDARIAAGAAVDVPAASTFLAEAPLCRGGDGDGPGAFTFYSVLMEPAERRLWLTDGPPDRSPYRPYDFATS